MKVKVSAIRTPSSIPQLQEVQGEDDEILLAEQGVYQAAGRPVWQIGELRLTSKQLVFRQPRGIIFDLPVSRIAGITTEHKRFTVVKKLAMAVSYRDPLRRDLTRAWFITLSMGRWLNLLNEMLSGQEGYPGLGTEEKTGMRHERREEFTPSLPLPATPSKRHPGSFSPLPIITQAQIELLAMELDPHSRELLWHLWLNKHATIGELAQVIAAPTHMDILFRIRQGINPVAEEMLGWPILVFEESRFDQGLGEMVTFSWWLAGEVVSPAAQRGPEVEVFNEAHEINVIVELPGVEEQSIRVSARREKVVVWVEEIDLPTGTPSAAIGASGSRSGYHVDIPLPEPVDGERVMTHFNNGILIIHLQKACAEPDPVPC